MRHDNELLQLARELDQSALGEIYDMYYIPVYKYIYQHIRHVETAQDLAGEVFHRMLEQLNTGKGPRRHLKAWLYRVAHNLVVDEVRSSRNVDAYQLDETYADTSPGVPAQAQLAMLSELAASALSGLSTRQRSVIILKFLIGLDNADVARTLGISVRAVKALQKRGLDEMHTRLTLAGATREAL